jgi:hypothetical protein
VQQGEENNKKIQRSDKENPIEKIAKPLDLAKTILELKGDGISVKTEKVENLFFNEKVKGNYTDAQKKTAMDYLLIPRDYIFEFRLPSFPLQSTLIYLKLRMTYETNGMGIGNISFSIVDSDSSMAGWQSDFEVMLTTSEIPVGGKTFIGSKFRLTINYNSKGWVGSESSSFLYEIDSFGGVKIIHGNSGKRMLQYNYPEGSKSEKYRKIVHQIAE